MNDDAIDPLAHALLKQRCADLERDLEAMREKLAAYRAEAREREANET